MTDTARDFEKVNEPGCGHEDVFPMGGISVKCLPIGAFGNELPFLIIACFLYHYEYGESTNEVNYMRQATPPKSKR